MAKKRKRRPSQRPRPRPQAGTPAADSAAREAAEAEGGQSVSRRAERKEEARRERERRIRQARRRQRNRKLIRWGILLGVVALIAGIVYISGRAERQEKVEAEAAADRISCTEIEQQEATLPNEHTEPFAQGEGGPDGTVPAFGGNHTGGALPPEPKVYQQQPPEQTAIHNLEHGYVIVYYAADGENALDEGLVSALEDLVNEETEVLMSPYEGLAQPLHFLAWGARQACSPPADASAADVVDVAEGFIAEWKNGQYAPEAAAS